jgi:hypothetical protein
LGGLPLALEQAAAHIKSIKRSFGDYVKRFQKKRLKLLKTVTQSPRVDWNKENLVKISITCFKPTSSSNVSLISSSSTAGLPTLMSSFGIPIDNPEQHCVCHDRWK